MTCTADTTGDGDRTPPQPIPDERALLIRDPDTGPVLVISDVHVGFEQALLNDGIYIPSQLPGILERIRTMVRANGVRRIIINGDLEDDYPKRPWKERKKDLDELDLSMKDRLATFDNRFTLLTERMRAAEPGERGELQREFEQLERERNAGYRVRSQRRRSIIGKNMMELRDVSRFLRILLDMVRVDVIPGNHDGRIEKDIMSEFPTISRDPNLHFADPSGLVVGNCGIFHGHTWPSEEVMSREFVIMGHGHAAILLTDDLGVRNYEPCWFRAGFTHAVHDRYPDARGEVIFMPSFNDFFRGRAVNGKGGLLGPIFRNGYVDVDNGRVVLLDGLELGKVKDLRRFAGSSARRR